MSTTDRKPAPAQLKAPLTLMLDGVALQDLNEYRQASYAAQWPPEETTGAERRLYVKHHQQLADQAALGLAMFLSDQVTRQIGEPVEL
ncbi:hypothetical protein F3J44_22695 [Pantoea sp. Tr-811]|uniref:hypothetical protein n=1 Tax=Pantoea sp. Tr-811 TaxID=2608361 RepID=UPI00141EA8CB|nr:hypothetical protein [Pantoea sp. Tr-811]NIF29174.1 hypothetical protein [Pantoea sp. Tr-811]